PLLLPDHRNPRDSPDPGHLRACRCAHRPLRLALARNSPDHGRLRVLVLALDGHLLALPLHSSGLLPVKRLALAAGLLFALLSAVPTLAQGCTQCRDNTAATPPATRRAYRHAIILMTVAGGGLFIATVTLLKRSR